MRVRMTDFHKIDALMIIDDNSFDQMMYKRIVEKSGRVRELIQYVEAEKALEHLLDGTREQPDLILLDINMPRMNGFEFLEAATARIGADLCPIIVMLTTSLHPGDEARARSFDVVHDFMNKPLTQAMLQTLGMLVAPGDTAA